MSETDEQFVERMMHSAVRAKSVDDWNRLNTIASRGVESGKMLVDRDNEYNRKTNALIVRHSETVARCAARIKQLEAALHRISLESLNGFTTKAALGSAARAALEDRT